MEKFTSYEKMSKKARKKLNAEKRRGWDGLNPVTRVAPDSKKAYKRKAKHPEAFDTDE